MNNKQQNTVEYIKENFMQSAYGEDTDYEMIDFSTEEMYGKIRVSFTHRLSIPGTIGYVLPCYKSFLIGRNGATYTLEYSKNKTVYRISFPMWKVMSRSFNS